MLCNIAVAAMLLTILIFLIDKLEYRRSFCRVTKSSVELTTIVVWQLLTFRQMILCLAYLLIYNPYNALAQLISKLLPCHNRSDF